MKKILSSLFPLFLFLGCETTYVLPDDADFATVSLIFNNPKNTGFWDDPENLSVYAFESPNCEGKSRVSFFDASDKQKNSLNQQVKMLNNDTIKRHIKEVRIGASKKQTILFSYKISINRYNGFITYGCGVLVDVNLLADQNYEMMFEGISQNHCTVDFVQLSLHPSLERKTINIFNSGFEEDRQACWEVYDRL